GISTLSTVPIDRIAGATDADLWFQLYLWGDRRVAEKLVNHAQDLGYRVLILSADATVRSKRERELRAGITLPTPHLTLSTVLDGARHPSWAWHFLTSDAITFPNVQPDGGNATTPSMAEMFD